MLVAPYGARRNRSRERMAASAAKAAASGGRSRGGLRKG